MTNRRPVTDWATDFDHLGDEWAAHSNEILANLRDRCPVAHTDRFHGAYLATRYDDIVATAQNTEVFSNRVTVVNENAPENINLEAPPITLDPPAHGPVRRAVLPPFNPKEVARLEPMVADIADRAVARLAGREHVDGALDYAQVIPVEVTVGMLGLPLERGDEFRSWVNGILKEGQADLDLARWATREVQRFFAEQLEDRRANPGDDLVTWVLHAEAPNEDGSTRPLTQREQIGVLFLLLVAGIDTTWSAIGASLYHLGTHPDDLKRLVDEPELMPTAVEELLRFYAPAMIARLITDDAEVGGCPVSAGQRVLLSFGSANRDPAHFDDPDEVHLDRAHNRHLTFGVGVHRCLGSNLARMEMRVALERWIAAFPRFELTDAAAVTWSTGAVRGPNRVPLRILDSTLG